MRPTDVESVVRLGIRGRFQHLCEGPRIVRQHGRPHFHGEERRVEPPRPLLDAAFPVHRDSFHQPAGGRQITRPRHVRGERPHQRAIPKAALNLGLCSVHQFVRSHQGRPRRGAGHEGVPTDARGFNLLLERKRRHESIRPVRIAVYDHGHFQRRGRTHEFLRPGLGFLQGAVDAPRRVFRALLDNHRKPRPGQCPVLHPGRSVGDRIYAAGALGHPLCPCRMGPDEFSHQPEKSPCQYEGEKCPVRHGESWW